jgi:trigger factor
MLKETKKLDGSQVELLFEVPAEVFIAREAEALKILGEELEIDGFRKGKAPEDVVKKYLPEIAILEKMAELAISDLYPKTVAEEKLDVIGRPDVAITKLARGNALEFKVKATVLPEIKLPEYKKIVKAEWKDESEEVTEEEVENAIKDIQKMRAHQKLHDSGVEHDHDAEGRASTDTARHDSAESDDQLEPLTDDFVKTIGNFTTVAEFREKLRDNMKAEKKVTNKDKNRSRMIEAITKETKADVPEILIQSELDKMIMQLRDTVERAGLDFNEYYKQMNKTEEEVKKDLKPDAEKRALMELVLFEIAKVEKLTPSEEEVMKEADALLARYPGADKLRAFAYVEQVLTNERVFEFLETQVK